jgi:hypothetical protein
LREIEKLTLTN